MRVDSCAGTIAPQTRRRQAIVVPPRVAPLRRPAVASSDSAVGPAPGVDTSSWRRRKSNPRRLKTLTGRRPRDPPPRVGRLEGLPGHPHRRFAVAGRGPVPHHEDEAPEAAARSYRCPGSILHALKQAPRIFLTVIPRLTIFRQRDKHATDG